MRAPANLRYSAVLLLLNLFVTTQLSAQDAATKKLVTEATRLRESNNSPDSDLQKAIRETQDRVNGLNDALRDWIESRIPKSKAALDAGYSVLQDRLNSELSRARVRAPADGVDGYGYVGRLELSQPSEFPGALMVVAGTSMPCGTLDSVYVYEFDAGPPRRALESRGTGEHDESVSGVYFSQPDTAGSRLVLTLRTAVQCGSIWNGLSYGLFRLRAGGSTSIPIFSGTHGVWFGADQSFNVQIRPDELVLELRDRSIDPRLHNRTHVLRYNVAAQSVSRVDPVALQPQDFVDEWITRPWSEMESRSSAAQRDKLEKWHNFLSGGFTAGDIDVVQPCNEKPDDWKIAVSFQWVAGKQLPEQFKLYFLVQGSGKFRFAMTAISFDPPDSCPGESPPHQASPSLFEEDPQNKGRMIVVPF